LIEASEKEDGMSEEKGIRPRDPAEGGEDEVEAPGADKAGQDRETVEGTSGRDESGQHPQEPAEGGEDEVEAPGADKPSEGG
jgi:hypothetical protein